MYLWSLRKGSVLLEFVVLLLVHGVAHAVCDGFLLPHEGLQ